MAGAPIGNQNAAKGRRWSKAIERAMEAYPDRAVSLETNKGVDNAAYEFVHQLMVEKDLGFFKELGDRMDGKPAQAIVGDADADPLQMVHKVVREIVRADSQPKDG